MCYTLFENGDANIVNAENLKKQLNYLVRAIVNARVALDDNIRTIIDEQRISAVRDAVKNRPVIQQALHRANIIRNDKALLRFMAQQRAFQANLDAKGLIAAETLINKEYHKVKDNIEKQLESRFVNLQ